MIDKSDTWPEDEAQMTALQYRDLLSIESETYADKWLVKQRAHMHKVFETDEDRKRYDDELNFLTRD